MKNKFWKITSIVMAATSSTMMFFNIQSGNWELAGLWSMGIIIWAINIKLYWND